jgi:phosphatidylglycerophosphate synthase
MHESPNYKPIPKLNEESIAFLKMALDPYIPFVARFLTSGQLTMCSLVWSALLIVSGVLARTNSLWLLLSVLSLLLHMFTDILDGSVSVYNNDGLYKWNFFMDHLLDYILALSAFFGIAIYFHGNDTTMQVLAFIFFALIAVNMVASFLMVAEQGLDIGISLDDRLSFNIFYVHFLLIVFYCYFAYYGPQNCDSSIMYYFIGFLLVLTVINISKKSQSLQNTESKNNNTNNNTNNNNSTYT